MDTQTALDWLLASDPAIIWQVLRDLTDALPEAIGAERARVPQEGVGAEILAAQEPDGAWRRLDDPAWLTTLFTLQLLRATGVDPADPAVVSALSRAEANLRWNDYPGFWDLRSRDFGPAPADGKHHCKPGGNPFFEGEEEPCINGGVLAFGSYFGHPNDALASRLLSEQLPDGGWNCDAPKSKVSSYHTTICVLEGLLEYERAIGPAHPAAAEVSAARRWGKSTCWSGVCSDAGQPEKSPPRSFWNSRSRRATTTTFFARSTISAPLDTMQPTRACRTRSRYSKANACRTDAGRSIRPMMRRSPSEPVSWWASQASGIRYALYEFCAG